MSRTIAIVSNSSKTQKLQLDEPGKGTFRWTIVSVDSESDKVGQSLVIVQEVADGPFKGKSHRKNITLPVPKDDWGTAPDGKANDYSSRDSAWNRFRVIAGISSKEQLHNEDELRAAGKPVPPINLDLDTLIGRTIYGDFEPANPEAQIGSVAAFSNLTYLEEDEFRQVMAGTLNLKSRTQAKPRSVGNANPAGATPSADEVADAMKNA